jgi:hypothetical protein
MNSPDFRKALIGLPRYIATVETAKHRVFRFLDASILTTSLYALVWPTHITLESYLRETMPCGQYERAANTALRQYGSSQFASTPSPDRPNPSKPASATQQTNSTNCANRSRRNTLA